MTRLVEIAPSQADLKFSEVKLHPFPLFKHGMIGDQDEITLSRVLGDSAVGHAGNMFRDFNFIQLSILHLSCHRVCGLGWRFPFYSILFSANLFQSPLVLCPVGFLHVYL